MSFDRRNLPDPIIYYESEGLRLTGGGEWKTTACAFHGGSDSMRINSMSGGFVCMAGCGARGGDVLAYHMASHGLGFVEAAKGLGAWVEDGMPSRKQKPAPLPPRAALEVLGFEALVVAVAAGNIGRGVELSPGDRERVLQSAGRINKIAEAFS